MGPWNYANSVIGICSRRERVGEVAKREDWIRTEMGAWGAWLGLEKGKIGSVHKILILFPGLNYLHGRVPAISLAWVPSDPLQQKGLYFFKLTRNPAAEILLCSTVKPVLVPCRDWDPNNHVWHSGKPLSSCSSVSIELWPCLMIVIWFSYNILQLC